MSSEINSGNEKLFNRNFILLFQGQLVSQLGNAIFVVAMIFWIKHETSSATMIGLFSMMAFLPAVLLGPFGGVFADVISRKKIIVYCDLFSGCATLLVAIPMANGMISTPVIMAGLLMLAIAGSSVSAVFRPAVNAMVPNLVPASKIQGANGLLQGMVQTTQLVGQIFGGILFRVVGTPVLMIINGVSFLLSSLSENFITLPEPGGAETERENSGTGGQSGKDFKTALGQFKANTAEGFTYVWRNSGLLSLFVIASVMNFFLAPILVLLPFFIEDHLKVLPDWYGYTIGMMALGTIIGSGLAGGLKISGRIRSKFLLVALVGLAVAFGAFAMSRNIKDAMITMTLVGICSGVVNVMVTSIVQITTPDEIRGRVFGLLNTISTALMPIGMGLTGVVTDLMNQNLPLVFLVCGIFSIIPVPLLAFNRKFHEFTSYDTNEVGQASVDSAESETAVYK